MIAGALALLVGLLAAGCNGEVVIGGQKPARVLVVSGDLQADTVGRELKQPLVVRVVDDRDKPIRNQLVNFVVTAGGGSVFAGSALTNADGEARERWTLGPVAGDTQRVEARAVDPATGEALVFATFRAVGVRDAAAALAAAGPTSFSGTAQDPVADSLAVRVADRFGNPVPGVAVTWESTTGGGTLSPASSVTGPSGIARSRWTLGAQVGTQSARATAVGQVVTFTAAAAPLPAASLEISPRAVTFASLGERTTLTVVARDRTGAAVGGVPVMLISENAAVAGLDGSSTVVASGNGTTRVIASAGALRDTAVITVQQVPAGVSVAGGVWLVAPDTPVPAARAVVTDAEGRPIAGVAVTWTVTSGGGTVAAPATITGTDGVASVDWRLGGGAGVQTLRAQAGSRSATVSARLRLPGYVFVQSGPVLVQPGSANTYTVEVRDSSNQSLPNTAVTWSVSGPATITSVSGRTGADGRAQATLTAGSAGSNFTIRYRAGTVEGTIEVEIANPITISNVLPNDTNGATVYQSYVTARIASSAGAITSARLSMAGRQAAMQYDDTTGLWRGSVDLRGVPGGILDGVLTSTDAAGNQRQYLYTIRHNPNPVVMIVEPAGDTVTATGTLRVRVTCTGLNSDGANVCPTLWSTLWANSTQVVAYAQGRSEIVADVPLPAGASSVRILVSWSDFRGAYYDARDELIVNVP
jgi:hypothetical protein